MEADGESREQEAVVCWMGDGGVFHVATTTIKVTDELLGIAGESDSPGVVASQVEDYLAEWSLEHEASKQGNEYLNLSREISRSTGTIGGPEVYRRPLVSDSEFVGAVLKIWGGPIASRHCTALLTHLVFELLCAAAAAGKCPIDWPADADEDTRDVLEEFLFRARPLHEAAFYLDDYWNFVWEDAWPEGVAEVILGSSSNDNHWAAELFDAVMRKAADTDILEDPTFDREDLVHFIRLWRERVLEALERVARSIG